MKKEFKTRNLEGDDIKFNVRKEGRLEEGLKCWDGEMESKLTGADRKICNHSDEKRRIGTVQVTFRLRRTACLLSIAKSKSRSLAPPRLPHQFP